MKLKEPKVPEIHQNKSFRIHSLPEKRIMNFIHPINHYPLDYTITSTVDEPFIVDWQLSGK